MLDQERNFMGSNLEDGAGAFDVAGAIAEAGIEEAGVVNAKLTIGRIEGNHFRCVLGRNTPPFAGCKNIKIVGFKDQTLAGILVKKLPELFGRIIVNAVEFNGGGGGGRAGGGVSVRC